MIVYGMNRLSLAQESTQTLAPALAPELEGARETALAAVPATVLAEGSGGEQVAKPSVHGGMEPADEDDKPPYIPK